MRSRVSTMIGETAPTVVCPICEAELHPRIQPVCGYGHTARSATRHAFYSHLRTHHYSLGTREMSLLCDQVCENGHGL
jgi:hypothetical protein